MCIRRGKGFLSVVFFFSYVLKKRVIYVWRSVLASVAKIECKGLRRYRLFLSLLFFQQHFTSFTLFFPPSIYIFALFIIYFSFSPHQMIKSRNRVSWYHLKCTPNTKELTNWSLKFSADVDLVIMYVEKDLDSTHTTIL